MKTNTFTCKCSLTIVVRYDSSWKDMSSLPWSLNADNLSNPERIWDDTHILDTLSLLSYKVVGILDRDFSSDLDEEDILRVYARDLSIYLVYERCTSTKKYDQE